jgi:5-methylcytosine-specific restriction endonuclease McrA
MANSHDRFYQLEFRHRPVLHGDISSLLKIDGLIVSGGGASAALMLPSSDESPIKGFRELKEVIHLSAEEWSEFLKRADDPEVLIMPGKAFHRKSRYEISGLVQQRIWVADGLKCMFCKRPMGEVQLTVDHFQPLETGGANDQNNYLSACRRCNKQKGAEDPREFCKRNGLDYEWFVEYLKTRIV